MSKRDKHDIKAAPPLRRYSVVYVTQRNESYFQTATMEIEAHFAFDNTSEGRGLVFRRYNDQNDMESKTYVVGEFKEYVMYQEIKK